MIRCRLFGHFPWLDLDETTEVPREPFSEMLDPDLYENVVVLEGPVTRICVRCEAILEDQEDNSRDCFWPDEFGRYIVLANGDDIRFLDWPRFLHHMRKKPVSNYSVLSEDLPRIGTRRIDD